MVVVRVGGDRLEGQGQGRVVGEVRLFSDLAAGYLMNPSAKR